MKAWIIALFVGAAALLASVPTTVNAEPSNSINLGIGMSDFLPDCDATVYLGEFEHVFGSNVTGVGRINYVHYTYDDGEHVEEGRPQGADLGLRYYFSRAMKGVYVSGLAGYWRSDWTFIHNRNLPDEFRGKAHSDSFRLNAEIGARIPVGASSVSIMPSLNFGRFFPSTSCEYTSPSSRVGESCNEESEVEDYAFAAITVGIAF